MTPGTVSELNDLGAEIVELTEEVVELRQMEFETRDTAYVSNRRDGLNHTEAERFARAVSREQGFQLAKAEARLAVLRFRYDHLRLLLDHGIG